MIAQKIRHRINESNQNFIGVLTGPTGSGKSWSALSLCRRVDPHFGMRRVCFSAPDFLAMVNRDLPRGSAILWDEAGLGMPAREWQSFFNKAVGYVLQSFRYRNLALLITVPDHSFLDRVPRSLFHFYFEVRGVDFEKEIVRAKPFEIQNNPRVGKVYMKHPRIPTEDGERAVLKTVSFSKPGRRLRELYELRRAEYMADFYKDLQVQASVGEGANLPKWAWKLLLDASNGKTQAQLGAEIGLSRSWVNRLLKIARSRVAEQPT